MKGGCAPQGKVDKLSEALRSSQKQAKQADAEVQEMEKAFRVLQTEASAAAITTAFSAQCMPDHPLACHAMNQCRW